MFPESYPDREAALLSLELFSGLLETDETAANGLGYSTDEEWQSLLDIEMTYGPDDIRLTEALPPSTYYTNDFLPDPPIPAP
jgi:hypothetical protein